MIIRDATIRDRAAILRFAVEQTKRYPKLRKDVDRMHGAITEVIGNSKHFAQVVEVDEEVKGALLCVTANSLWAQRQNSNIALWTSEVPGGGVRLLRSYKRWIKGGRSVKIAGICPDIELDARALRILELTGFERHGGAYLLYN